MFLVLTFGVFVVALAGAGPEYAPVAKAIYALMVAAHLCARIALRGDAR